MSKVASVMEAVVEFRGAERYGSAACLDLGLSIKSLRPVSHVVLAAIYVWPKV